MIASRSARSNAATSALALQFREMPLSGSELLLTHERKKWSSREEQYRYRTSSRNTEFVVSPIDVDLEKTNEIVLPVKRRA